MPGLLRRPSSTEIRSTIQVASEPVTKPINPTPPIIRAIATNRPSSVVG
jgi:hypothetical protein